MSTVSPNLDHITLDPGDSGIQWIPGVGFRPVDMTEELPFFNQMDCDIIDTGTQCEQGNCSFGKGGGKYDLEHIPPVYVPEVITYAPAYNSPLYATPYVPVFWWDDPWNPPTWECCTYITPIPPTPEPPAVPLGSSGLFILTALAAIIFIRRFS